ncbi:MAG: CRISPR-associated endoribonuclease Cas6 [candidate division WOR-3 bacterium]
MRLKILMGEEEKWYKFPWGYPYHVSSLIYNLLHKVEPELSFLLHTFGFQKGNKKFKIFNFSPLLPKKFIGREDFCYLLAPFTLYFSTPIEEIIEKIVKAIKKEGKVTLLGYILPIIKIKEIPVSIDKEVITLRTLSPLTISRKIKIKDKITSLYLTPENEDFIPRIKENLIEKFSIFYDVQKDEIELEIEPISYHVKLVEIKNIKVKGVMMEFKVKASLKEIIKFGYEAGFGEKTSMGFGFVEEC